MKLKTKFQDEDFDLGEVVEADIYNGGDGKFKVIAEPTKGGMITFYFETLKELNEMFEDHENPDLFYYVDADGSIKSQLVDDRDFNNVKDGVENLIAIGNWFETREEAEKAVEKLKAWKRLEDNGMIKYAFHKEKTGIDLDFYTLTILAPRDKGSLDLLFGGEE
jgi:hypothetical protein